MSNDRRDYFEGFMQVMTPSEFRAFLVSRINALEEDINTFGPTGPDLSRLSRLQKVLEEHDARQKPA